MKIITALVLSSCLLILGCMGAEEEGFVDETLQAPTGQVEQGLCYSHCDCGLGTQCVSGSCMPYAVFGPSQDPCVADCQCGPGRYCRPISATYGTCTYY
jgi:hypothetical protein